jgi:Putative peptidoglycan binding domain
MKWRGVAVIAMALVLVVGLADLASAHRVANGNWSQHDTLCVSGSCNTQGNQVGMWQTILWADHLVTGLDKCGSSGVDGYFGSVTKSATKSWQSWYGLTSDGIVGDNTWSKARGFVVFDYTFGEVGNKVYHYVGYNHNPRYIRVTNATPDWWQFESADVCCSSDFPVVFDSNHTKFDFFTC